MTYFKKFLLVFIFILFFSNAYGSSDKSMCSVAADISKKASALLDKDKTKALKLFIKAERLCPEPAYDYNLAMAYWRYGAPDKAVSAMLRAVDGKKIPLWENNLSIMLIKTGKDSEKALACARRAFKSDPGNPSYADTLVQAEMFAGNDVKAVSLASEFGRKWKSNKKIIESRNFIFDRYLTKYLLKIKNNNFKDGLSGLEKAASIFPGAGKAYSLALLKVGKKNRAFDAAMGFRKNFGKTKDSSELINKVAKSIVNEFYKKYQRGDEKKALSLAKAFSEKHPDLKIASETYNRMFDAYINSGDISVPSSVSIASSRKIKTGSDALMDDVFSGKNERTKIELVPDIEKNIFVTKRKRPHAVAVVIGNKDYRKYNKGINDVQYAIRDASVMKEYLVKTFGFDNENILYVNNTTSADLRDIFGTRTNRKGRLSRYVRKGISEVFIYYSGHGAPGADGESAFLVPVDASADFIANSGYPLDLFYEQVERLNAKSVIVVLESCFSGDSASGALFKNISPAMVRNIRPVENVKSASVFCSADKNQVATWYPEKRHGLFTYFFLKGISGAADRNKDKKVTTSELSKYLKAEVPYWAGRKSNREQTPLVKSKTELVITNLKQ